MVLQVLKPTPKKSQLDAISQALGIASSIYGIRSSSAKLDALSRQAEAEERRAAGDLTPIEAAETAKRTGTVVGAEETPGGIGIKIGGKQRFLTPKADKASEIERLKIQKLKKELKLSPGEKKVDLEFGKEFTDFFVRGKIADAQKGIKQLEEVSAALGESDSLTGPLVGSIPDFLKKRVAPKAAAIQQTVEEVVQRNLRVILGAQFTEKEGERLISRAYDPVLSEAENKKRVDRLLASMQTAVNAKIRAGKYFQANGTLKGYDGVTNFKDIVDDFDAGVKKQPTKQNNKITQTAIEAEIKRRGLDKNTVGAL